MNRLTWWSFQPISFGIRVWSIEWIPTCLKRWFFVFRGICSWLFWRLPKLLWRVACRVWQSTKWIQLWLWRPFRKIYRRPVSYQSEVYQHQRMTTSYWFWLRAMGELCISSGSCPFQRVWLDICCKRYGLLQGIRMRFVRLHQKRYEQSKGVN